MRTTDSMSSSRVTVDACGGADGAGGKAAGGDTAGGDASGGDAAGGVPASCAGPELAAKRISDVAVRSDHTTAHGRMRTSSRLTPRDVSLALPQHLSRNDGLIP